MSDVSRTIRVASIVAAGVASLCLCLWAGGCSETMDKSERSFTNQHQHRTHAATSGANGAPAHDPYDGSRPFVISPNRDDGGAFHRAMQELDEADWKALEKLAPRHEWEGVLEKQEAMQRQQAHDEGTAQTTGDDTARFTNAVVKRKRNVPTVTRRDGQVQIYYRLWHYGGVTVDAGRKDYNDHPMVKTSKGSLEPMIKIVENFLGKDGTVEQLPGENMLVITCAPEAQTEVLELLDNLDTARRQVEITVRIFEVSDDFDLQFGVRTVLNHLGGNNSQGFLGNFDAADFAGEVIDPINAVGPNPGSVLKLVNMFQKAGVGVDITFEALEETGLVKVVSAPRMTVSQGEPAFMMAGQELPIREGRVANDKFVTQQIKYKPIGVQLHITPQIIGDNSTKLHLLTIVSAISGFAPLPTLNEHELSPAIMNPILDSRQAETRVEVPHGSTLVFGGLRMVRRVAMEEKVPVMGDVPVLGWLFKNSRTQKQLSDLYFFVTPRLVQ